jgi:hypothetical protein
MRCPYRSVERAWCCDVPHAAAHTQNVLVQGYHLSCEASMATVCTVGVRDFYFLHGVQTGSGAHPVSCPRGTRRCFPRGKVAGA